MGKLLLMEDHEGREAWQKRVVRLFCNGQIQFDDVEYFALPLDLKQKIWDAYRNEHNDAEV